MEVNRLEFREILTRVMEDCGETPKLYFQSPESMKLEYPCFLYKLDDLSTRYANNDPYNFTVRYSATYITRSPTSSVPLQMLKQHGVAFERYYVAENLHHYVYTYVTNVKEEANG